MKTEKPKKKPAPKKKSTIKAVAKRDPNQVINQGDLRDIQTVNPQALIMTAIERNVPIEVLERLLVMRDKIRGEMAEVAFRESMSAFQAECPIIIKLKPVYNTDGTVRYRYAPIEDIIPQVQPLMEKHGFSFDIETEQKGEMLFTTTTAYHILGHSKKSIFGVPTEFNPALKMSEQHKWISAQTIGKRVSFCNVFGILTGDGDNNGEPQGDEITDEQKEEKERKRQEAMEKLDNLPDEIKEGFKILQYEDGARYIFCQQCEWNNDKIKSEINKIIDAREAKI